MSFCFSSFSSSASGGFYSYSGSYVASHNQPFEVWFEDQTFVIKTITLFWRHMLWLFCIVTPPTIVLALIGNAILARSHNPHLTYADLALACTLGGIFIILLRCIFQLLLHTLRLMAVSPDKVFSHFSPNAPVLFTLLAYTVIPSATLASTGTAFLLALDACGRQTAREELHAIDVLYAFEAALIGSAVLVGVLSALHVIVGLLFQPRALLDSLWVFAVGPGQWRLFSPSNTDTSGIVGNNNHNPTTQSVAISAQSDLRAEDGEGTACYTIGTPPPAYAAVETGKVARSAGDIV